MFSSQASKQASKQASNEWSSPSRQTVRRDGKRDIVTRYTKGGRDTRQEEGGGEC